MELAAIVRAPMRHVNPAEAMAGVAGYTVANDVSAHDLQFSDGQWVRGKSLDTFCPLGPVVVTPDETGDPQALHPVDCKSMARLSRTPPPPRWCSGWPSWSLLLPQLHARPG